MALNLPVIITRPRPHSRRLTTADPPPVSPIDLGLPAKFTAWRRDQWDGIDRIISSTKRFVVICAPTGSGKTGIGLGAAALSGERTVILTATKGLQDQVAVEAESLVSDIRGLNNYLCPITEQLGIPRDTSVADAPCQCGYRCPKRNDGCRYYSDYRQAQRASIVVTNYACWMHDGAKESGERGDLQFGQIPAGADLEESERIKNRQKVGMLICDECHSLEDMLSMFLGVDFSRRECLAMHLNWPDVGLTVDDWREWAIEWRDKLAKRVESGEQKVKNSNGKNWSTELKHLRDIKRKLDRLSGMQADDGWILNEDEVSGRSMTSVRFDPLSPARYAEQVLWRNVEKIVLVSATVRPKTAELLGIDNSQLEFYEYDSSFDPKRRPVIYIPSERMTYHSEQDDSKMKWWLSRLDDLLEKNLHHKGIIHCVSYRRMEFIKNNSRFAEYMLTHNTRDRGQVVERFRRMDAPSILLSPSLDTGYDFKDSEARFQVVAKLPFASTKDRVIKARQEKDKEYGMYLTAQTLVQMSGRIVRGEKDFGVTYLVDGNFEWMYGRCKRYFPNWFTEAVMWADSVPEPLEFDNE